MSADRRRVVVTGIGVVAPGSIGREAFWDMITAGRTATRRITFFDPSRFRSQVAAEVAALADLPASLAERAHAELEKRVGEFFGALLTPEHLRRRARPRRNSE